MVNYGDVNDVNTDSSTPETINGSGEPHQNDNNPTQDDILSHFQEVTGK